MLKDSSTKERLEQETGIKSMEDAVEWLMSVEGSVYFMRDRVRMKHTLERMPGDPPYLSRIITHTTKNLVELAQNVIMDMKLHRTEIEKYHELKRKQAEEEDYMRYYQEG